MIGKSVAHALLRAASPLMATREVARALRSCTLALVFAAMLTAADRRPVPWEKNHLRIGQALYRENCVVCHDIDRQQSKKLGPSFYQLFQRPQMPIAKMKPSREYIKVRVKFGGALMPAFRRWLTDRDIDTLIDYMASLPGGSSPSSANPGNTTPR